MSRYHVLKLSCTSGLIGAILGASYQKFSSESQTQPRSIHADHGQSPHHQDGERYDRWKLRITSDQQSIGRLFRSYLEKIGLLGSEFYGAKQSQNDESEIRSRYGIPLPIVSAASSTLPPPPSGSAPPSHGLPAVVRNSSSDEIMRHGFPGFDNIRSYGDFVLSYDRRTRTPHWVFEHLTPTKVDYRMGSAKRENSQFYEDSSIHSYFRGTNEDYKHSGYDRGHMAAAANHRFSQAAMNETFVLSNIAPQVGVGFNRGAWNQLEKFVRGISRKYINVYVCTGPLYLPRDEGSGKLYVRYQVLGENHVAVPTHFFKVVLAEHPRGGFELLSFVMPNENLGEEVDLKRYLVRLDVIERAAGLLFFEKLPRNALKRINGM